MMGILRCALRLPQFNHSCDPNCVVNADTQMLEVITIRQVARGEELTIGYVKHEGVPRAARRRQLLEQYNFECACTRCADPFDGNGGEDPRSTQASGAAAAAEHGGAVRVGAGGGTRGGGTAKRTKAEQRRRRTARQAALEEKQQRQQTGLRAQRGQQQQQQQQQLPDIDLDDL
jgi:hypothetical protein